MDQREVEEAIADIRQKALAEEQERVTKVLVEINTKTFEKTQAYTNVIILAGYAGSFTIWTYTRPFINLRANVIIASLLGLSVVIFVLWEVFGMFIRARQFMHTRNLLVGHSTPETFFAKLKEAQTNEARQAQWLMPVWLVIIAACLLTAPSAVGLLFYNYFDLLVEWPTWPH